LKNQFLFHFHLFFIVLTLHLLFLQHCFLPPRFYTLVYLTGRWFWPWRGDNFMHGRRLFILQNGARWDVSDTRTPSRRTNRRPSKHLPICKASFHPSPQRPSAAPRSTSSAPTQHPVPPVPSLQLDVPSGIQCRVADGRLLKNSSYTPPPLFQIGIGLLWNLKICSMGFIRLSLSGVRSLTLHSLICSYQA
jgi:hypothetical protein